MAAKIKHIPYRSLSASPTLTNPDMILPDYDYNQSSSPDAEVLPPTMWKNNLTSNFVAGPATPTTPIIYGNGTMLSDIGEVTEVESTIENPSIETTGSISIESTENLGRLKFSSSYTGGTTTNLESVKSDRLTSETSPAMTNERNAISVNFHDSISSEDSNFQGDDEESLTSSYHSKVDTILEDTETYNIQSNSRVVSEIKFSTTSLGKRAEEILANAKQRLNVRTAVSLAFLLLTFCRKWREIFLELGQSIQYTLFHLPLVQPQILLLHPSHCIQLPHIRRYHLLSHSHKDIRA